MSIKMQKMIRSCAEVSDVFICVELDNVYCFLIVYFKYVFDEYSNILIFSTNCILNCYLRPLMF